MNQVERIGRFEVQERLRSNPFAIVYRGRDPFDGPPGAHQVLCSDR